MFVKVILMHEKGQFDQKIKNLLWINSLEAIGHPAVGLVVIFGNLGWPASDDVPEAF